MPIVQERRPDAQRAVSVGLWFLIVVQIIRLVLAMTRALQVDELQILHLAWLRSAGERPGIDYAFPQFSLLIDLLEPMWIALGPSLSGIFVARALLWLVSVGVVAVTGLYAGRLFGPVAGVGAALTLSLVSDFNEQAFEIRADPLLALLSVGGLLLISRGGPRALTAAGVCVAAMVAFSFKSLLFVPFAYLAATLPLLRTRDWRALAERLFRFSFGFGAGLLAYAGYLAARGDLALFFETITRNIEVSADAARFDPLTWVRYSIEVNGVFYALAAIGLIVLLARAFATMMLEYSVPVVYAAVFIAANPTFFPYNLIDVTPVVAVAAGAGLAALWRWQLVQFVLLLMMAYLPLYRASLLPVRQPIRHQLDANRLVMAMTAPAERVYDASGLILFRRGPYQWRLHSLMRPRYTQGEFRLADEIMRRPVRLVLPSYRTRWLVKSDREFLTRTFVLYKKEIAVAGATILPGDWRNGRARFLIVGEGEYSVHLPQGTAARIDGRRARARMRLARGWHLIEADPPPATHVVIVWAGANPELLDRFPPSARLRYYW